MYLFDLVQNISMSFRILELPNGVPQNDITLRVTNSNNFMSAMYIMSSYQKFRSNSSVQQYV